MTRFLAEGPVWRRAIATAFSMVFVSFAFVICSLLALDSVIDLAIAPMLEPNTRTSLEPASGASQPAGQAADNAVDNKADGTEKSDATRRPRLSKQSEGDLS